MAVTLLVGLAQAGSGCQYFTAPNASKPLTPTPPTFGRPTLTTRPATPGQAAGGKYSLIVRLQLVPVEVPIGTISKSERLWSYLDEEIVGPEAASALNRNGLRVGRGRMENWEPFSKLLRDMTGKTVERASSAAFPSRPTPILLKEHQPIQTIFTFNSRGELKGFDYPPGDDILMLTCHLNDDDPSGVLVQAVPLVRSTAHQNVYVKTESGNYTIEQQPVLFPLEALEFKAPVPQGYYLVIGPGTLVSRPTSPGAQFLVKDKQGLRYETLLVIVPEVLAVQQ